MKYFVTIAIFVIVFLSFSLAQIPTDSLVAYYPFNGNANDESGNGHNGVVHGSVLVNDRFGTIGKAYSFNGISDYISTDFPGILGARERSIAFWAKSNLGNKSMVALSYGDTNDVAGESFRCEFNTTLGPGPEVDVSYALLQYQGNNADSIWHFYVWVVPNIPNPKLSDAKIYMDGVWLNELIYNHGGNSENAAINTPFGQNVYIGKYWNNDYSFSGCIDDIRIYNRALNESEIQTLYHDDGLVAYYPFNGNANDESGNGNNGENHGAVSISDRLGISNRAYTFAEGTYIDIPFESYTYPDQFTLAIWLTFNDLMNPDVAIRAGGWNGDADAWKGYSIGIHQVYPALYYHDYKDNYWNAELYYPTSSLEPGEWYLLVIVRTLDSAKMFINGNLVKQQGGLTPYNKPTVNPLRLGLNYGNTINHNGNLDELKIYNRILSKHEIKSLYCNYRQQIVSIKDIPNDQGGKVRIKWDKIYLDTTGANPQITSYGVWRKIPLGMSVTKHIPSPMSIKNDTLGVLYDYLGTVNATQSPFYNFVAQTLADSPYTETFLITAHTSDPNVCFISEAQNGYSIDNLAPSAVTLLAAVWQSGTSVQLSWDANNKDSDLKMYSIYRSTSKSFTPTLELLLDSTTESNYQDATVIDGYRYYYQVCCVDYHGNKSTSPEVSSGHSTTRSITFNSGWNMISVPIDQNDFSKIALFPSAISDAFGYDGTYQSCDTLQKGRGYWLKFSSSDVRSLDGFLINNLPIDVHEGWNMIGSISEPVNVTDITSNPANIITSQFFGYDVSYNECDVITPGVGYWVKVSSAGQLTLSTSALIASSKIKIIPISELPPQPPEKKQLANSIIPEQYCIEQNYPNPFNPSTSIRYGIPKVSLVTLSVYNTLGQRVALLVDEKQEAGYHEVTFDGAKLTSGMYFYRLQAGDPSTSSGRVYTETKKLLLLK
jgi:hypothetical protein